MEPPDEPRPIHIPKLDKGKETVKEIGKGFAILETLTFQPEAGDVHNWIEQWFIVQSHTYANTQKKTCLSRIEKAEAELNGSNPKRRKLPNSFAKGRTRSSRTRNARVSSLWKCKKH
jgi:hypothetical protein